MNLFFTKTFFVLILICVGFHATAQTKFTASVSPSKAGKDEYITLFLTVANGANVQKITPPVLNDFNIVSGPNTTTEQNTINGETTQYISISYVLLAKKNGVVTIPPATALIDGRTFKSNSVDIVVSKNKSAGTPQSSTGATSMQSMLSGIDPFFEPQEQITFRDYILRKGESIQKKVNDNMQLRLEINKSSCYVGEALLATYKLYSRLKSESNLAKNPSFNGFSVIEMTQPNGDMSYSNEKLNGKSYNVYTIRKAQLYPLQAGEMEVESATLDNKISFIKYSGINGNNYNIDPNALITETVALTSKPGRIIVKPLPDAGKPEGFKGAVGNFTMETVLQKNTFATDETGKLFITITGSGNMHLITVPEIKWSQDFEVFDAKVTDNTDSKTVPISGSKTFEIPFAVGKEGTYKIPAISFSYFDPVIKAYKNIVSQNISFTVTEGKTLTNVTTSKRLREDGSLGENIISSKWLIILFLTGVMIVVLIFWMSRGKKEKPIPIISNTESGVEKSLDFYPIQNPLTKTEDCLFKNECDNFYTVINDELKTFLSKVFKISIEDLNNKRLAIAMDKAGVSNEIILQTHELVKEIEFQLYTPYEKNEELNRMYTKAQTIVQLLTNTVVS